jgi:polysaccharide pyruvyl transferase WcaK-like protein
MLLKVEQLRDSVRIALLTPYDGGNLGDSAIQGALIANLRSCEPHVDLCGITLHPARTSARHQIPCYSLTATSRSHYRGTKERDDGERPLPVAEASVGLYRRLRRMARAVPFVRWLKTGVDETLHAIRSYRLLRDVDVLAIAGGGQLDDEWGGSWGHPYALMKWTVLARAAGSSVAFLSVGACRIESRLTRLFLKTALSLACYRSYRDAESRRLALGITPRADGSVVPDLGFSLSGTSIEPSIKTEGAPLFVGVSPIAYGHAALWPTADQVQHERYLEELAGFVREILRRGVSVTLFSSSPPDDQIFADLLERVELGLDSASRGRLCARNSETVEELFDVLHAVDLVVASRLHGVMLSFLSGRPAIAISYDRKVTSLMAELGQAEYCLDIHSFKSDDLLRRFFALQAHSKVIQSAVASTCREYDEVLKRQCRDITRLALRRRRSRFRRNGDTYSKEARDSGPEGRPGIKPVSGPMTASATETPGTGNRDEMSYGKR